MVAQSWRLVTLLHWPVEPAMIARLLPEPLQPDLFDGHAWVSLTPFSTTCEIAGVVPVPGPRRFPETNVRTYVRGPDDRDGLYFLSLDVTNRSNAVLGRWLRLPYHVSDMTLERGSRLRYAGSRRATNDIGYDVVVIPGAPKTASRLDVFLTGRWSAYVSWDGVIVRYDVEHERWPLHDASVVSCHQTMLNVVGLEATPPSVVHFAPAVHARLAPARASRRRRGS
jgi:uncharacterized protein YqjF (DUF2071 family)